MNEGAIVPLYQQIKEDIKTAIQQGKYKPKEKIPPEPELSAEYSVSRITVRRAVEELCNEGYLVKRQGLGTFVSTPRIHRKITESNIPESFTKTCQNYGMTAGAKLLQRQIVPARQDEQEFFELEAEALLVYIQRLRTADEQPVFLENLFLPYEQYKSLMSAELNNVSAFDVIHGISGHRPSDTTYRTLEIARASAEQAQKLSVSLGEPLFYLNAYFVNEQKQPLCIGRQYYIGSRYMFEL